MPVNTRQFRIKPQYGSEYTQIKKSRVVSADEHHKRAYRAPSHGSAHTEFQKMSILSPGLVSHFSMANGSKLKIRELVGATTSLTAHDAFERS